MTIPTAAKFFAKTGASGIFPVFSHPDKLKVLDVRPYSWEEQLTAACFQGLVNRAQPRLYLVHDDVVDRQWLAHYKKTHEVGFKEMEDFDELLARYAGEVAGYVVCHEEMVHTMNVAQTWGSLNNAVAATPRVAEMLEAHGLKKLEDFRGKFRDRIDAYEWAAEHLLPSCNPRIIGHCCTEGWYPAKNHKYLPHIKDYLVAAGAFTFDLSSRKRDRREYLLFDKILSTYKEDGVMLGWHCSKCWESEYVALGARHGFFVFCNLRSPNYSVHSGVGTPGFKFKQTHTSPKAVKVEQKVYLTFIHSDGDAIWAKNNFYARNWLDSQRGKFPCTWELQPYAIDFAPGQLEYYYRTRTDQDYFIAGPSGAGYTAPIINKHQDRFLANTAKYFKKCDIRSILIMNRDPYDGYEEIDNGAFPQTITEAIPEAYGFIHGYSGNPFGQSVFVGDKPYLQTAQYVGDSHDIHEEVTKFATLVDRRPLFVAVHVRETADFASLRSTVDRLDPEVFKVVNVDEFLLTLTAAKKSGKVTDLSLDSPGLRDRYRKEAAHLWTTYYGNYQRHQTVAAVVDLAASDMLREFRAANLSFPWTAEELPDILGWETVDPLMRLVRPALQAKGIHVTRISEAAAAAVKAYADVPDIGVITECYELWRDWLKRPVELEPMRALAKRVVAVVRRLGVLVAEAAR